MSRLYIPEVDPSYRNGAAFFDMREEKDCKTKIGSKKHPGLVAAIFVDFPSNWDYNPGVVGSNILHVADQTDTEVALSSLQNPIREMVGLCSETTNLLANQDGGSIIDTVLFQRKGRSFYSASRIHYYSVLRTRSSFTRLGAILPIRWDPAYEPELAQNQIALPIPRN